MRGMRGMAEPLMEIVVDNKPLRALELHTPL